MTIRNSRLTLMSVFSALVCGGCATHPAGTTVRVFGPEVAEITGPVPHAFATNLFHRIGDNSFSGSGTNWNSPANAREPARSVKRGAVQTHDAEARPIEIEFIEQTGRPTLMFVRYDGPGGAAKVMSAALNELGGEGATINGTSPSPTTQTAAIPNFTQGTGG